MSSASPKPWTPAEAQLAQLLRADGWSASAIARCIPRSRNAIIGHLHRPGQTVNDSRWWSPEELASLRKQWIDGVPIRDIHIPGRTGAAIYRKIQTSGLNHSQPRLRRTVEVSAVNQYRGAIICDPDGQNGGGHVVGGRR